jgi:acyl-CoA synthetase (AMP-forming)/AMP-acid ligase II
MRDVITALQTLRDLLERNARLHGDDIHLQFGGEARTFREFARRTKRLAAAMQARKLLRQDRVAILAMNCPEYLEVYGIGEVSALAVVTVNFRLAPPEIAWILRDVTPRVLFFEAQYCPVIETLRAQLPSIEHYVCIGAPCPEWASPYEEVLTSAGDDVDAALRPASDDVTAILYTSGTTGRPKGAMHSHASMLASGEAWSYELAADIGDKVLLAMPLFHVGARTQGLALTFRGGTMVVHRGFDALEVVRAIEHERITQVHLAPTLVQQVLALPDIDRYDLRSLKTINYAAAPMPVTVLRRALARFGPIMINGFGQTEGAGLTLRKRYHRPDGDERDLRRLASVGQPNIDTQVRIVDELDREVAAGTIGEICLRSPQNMVGYWNNSAATAETLRGGWLHMGDMGYVDEDGFAYLADRKKDMIISGGENVYSREVEEALMAHVAVGDAAVIGVPDQRWGEAVKAIVVLKAGATVTSEALIAHCRTLIAGYKCPKSIEFLAELPRLPSGKVSKVSLRERYRR